MSTAVDDDLWSAIGDPTRRRMLDLLLSKRRGMATSLSEHLPVTRQAVAKTSPSSTASASSTPGPKDAKSSFPSTKPSSPAPPPSSPTSARPGTPDSCASSASPKPSRTPKETSTPWTSCTASASRSPHRTRSTTHSPPSTASPAGGPRRPRGTPTSAASSRSGSSPGGFDMKVIELGPGPARPLGGRRRPAGVGRHDDPLGRRAARRPHDRAVQARRLARGRRVHAPLQHEVGHLPDEPQAAPGDRGGRPGTAGRHDQRLALTLLDIMYIIGT